MCPDILVVNFFFWWLPLSAKAVSIYRLTGSRELNVKAVVAAFNQEKALVGAFSVITNLRMELLSSTRTDIHTKFLGWVSVRIILFPRPPLWYLIKARPDLETNLNFSLSPLVPNNTILHRNWRYPQHTFQGGNGIEMIISGRYMENRI